jgi:choline dehydrogenase-like flavoprotein
LTDSIASRILFDGRKATGVQTLSGSSYHATKEVIICAGTFDSARLLLLSGIGPSNELSALSIPVVSDVPGVGKNMKDHAFATTTLLAKPFAADPAPAIDPTLQVGPQSVMAWLSSEAAYSSSEFAALDEKTKAHLLKVPSFELMTSAVPISVMHLGYPADTQVITFIAAIMNPLSCGSIRLTSADPSVPALIDPAYISHPYDRRVAIEALRKTMQFSRAPTFAALTKKVIQGPASDSDDDIWEHWKKSLSPVWHFAGSCKMGRAEDKAAVVDTSFKVRGVEALRVADMSIVPVLPNNHTMSTAYLVGETAAEKLIKEYQL